MGQGAFHLPLGSLERARRDPLAAWCAGADMLDLRPVPSEQGPMMVTDWLCQQRVRARPGQTLETELCLAREGRGRHVAELGEDACPCTFSVVKWRPLALSTVSPSLLPW